MTSTNSIYHSKILGTGSFFPRKKVSNFDLEKTVQTSHEWIVERTGIEERRIADPSHGESNSSLALTAAHQALQSAGLKPEDLDFILYATNSGDFPIPNTACILQKKLGLSKIGALDITAACSGFVYGLSIADAFIRAGQYKNILLIGAEVLSPSVNWLDRNTCILFGDGAGAAIIGRSTDSTQSRIYSSRLHADGEFAELLNIPSGGSFSPNTLVRLQNNEHYIQMRGKEIFKVAVRMLADSALEVLEAGGFSVDDVDWFVPHQANLRIIEATAKRLGLPMEKVIVNIQKYANTSAATIPTALDEGIRSGKIQRGQLLLLDVFGAGITYGATLLRY